MENMEESSQQKNLTNQVYFSKNSQNPDADKQDLLRWKRPLTEECSQCGKMFSRAADLRLHMRTHTGERPYKCDICPKAFAQSSHLTKHRRVHTGERPYKCALCELSFTQSSNLKKHVRTHFKVGKKKKALMTPSLAGIGVGLNAPGNTQNVRVANSNNLHNHFSNNRFLHKCKFCWRQFLSYTALQVHIKKHIRCPRSTPTLSSVPITQPQMSNPIVLRDQEPSFNQRNSSNIASSSDSLTPVSTNISYSLPSPKPPLTDVINVHESEGANQNSNEVSNSQGQFYNCAKCPAYYSDLGDMLNHACYEHGEAFQCRLCPAIFIRKPDLEAHKNLHTLQARRELARDQTLEKSISKTDQNPSNVIIQSFQCNQCELRFSSSDDFTHHLELKHHQEKLPLTQQQQQRSSVSLAKRSLRRALTTHSTTSAPQFQQYPPLRPLRRPESRWTRLFSGNGAAFNKGSSRESLSFGNQSLVNFRSRLSGLRRPHGCVRCGKFFLRPGDLRLHMRTHTGEKPFRCDLCPKAFAQTSHLTKHRRVHTGERPYKCALCNLGFTQSSNLKKHVRIHFRSAPNKSSNCEQTAQESGFSSWNSPNLNVENQDQRTCTKNEFYPCSSCQLTFFTPEALTSHLPECTRSRDNCSAQVTPQQVSTANLPNIELHSNYQSQLTAELNPLVPSELTVNNSCEIEEKKPETQSETSNSDQAYIKQEEVVVPEIEDIKSSTLPSFGPSLAPPSPLPPSEINLDDFPEPIEPKFEVIDLEDSPPQTNSSPSFLSQHQSQFSPPGILYSSPIAPPLVSSVQTPVPEATETQVSTSLPTFTQAVNAPLTAASIFDPANPRPHLCTVCGKSFIRNADIRLHMRTHTGERPFRCDICPKAFSQTSHLTKHRRVHTGEKPYKCAICSLGFTQSSNLKKHVQTHARKSLATPRFNSESSAALLEDTAPNLPVAETPSTEDIMTNQEMPSLLIENLEDLAPSFVGNFENSNLGLNNCRVKTEIEFEPAEGVSQSTSTFIDPGINTDKDQFQIKTEGLNLGMTLNGQLETKMNNTDPFFAASFQDQTKYSDLGSSLVKQELPMQTGSSSLFPIEMPAFQKSSEAEVSNFSTSASLPGSSGEQIEYLSTTSSDGQVMTTFVQSIAIPKPFETDVIDIDDDDDEVEDNDDDKGTDGNTDSALGFEKEESSTDSKKNPALSDFPTEAPTKKFPCRYCSKTFNRTSDLVAHTRIHTGERPFRCEICGRTFNQLSHLTKHRRVHTGEKPYKCQHCDSAFTQSNNLHKHLKTHNK